MHPLLGTWPTTQACVLTENWTGDPLVHRPALNSLSHTNQGTIHEYFKVDTLLLTKFCILFRFPHSGSVSVLPLHRSGFAHVPSSEVSTNKSFLVAQNGVCGDRFLMQGAWAPDWHRADQDSTQSSRDYLGCSVSPGYCVCMLFWLFWAHLGLSSGLRAVRINL